METLNVFIPFHTCELIYKDHIYLHKKMDLFDKNILEKCVFNIVKNTLYKYLTKIDKILPNNTSIRNIRQSNLFSSLNNNSFNIQEYSICDLSSFSISKMVNYRFGENYILYKVKKFILFIFLEDYTGNIIINGTTYSNNPRGTLFILPYSFIFNISFDTISTCKILTIYISENIKKITKF